MPRARWTSPKVRYYKTERGFLAALDRFALPESTERVVEWSGHDYYWSVLTVPQWWPKMKETK